MKLVLSTLATFMVVGCTMPSFYDDNESLLAVDVRVAVSELDCSNNVNTDEIVFTINRLAMYSESKGSEDVQNMVQLMKKTADGMLSQNDMSVTYCEMKKKFLIKQSKDIANAVMERY